MKPTRRQFITAASMAATAPFIIPRSVLGQNGKPGANDTVKVGLIGMGRRCRSIYPNEVKPVAGLKVVGVCDLWPTQVATFMDKYPGDLKPEQGYSDFRKMIEKEKPDGVMVITATHQRAGIASIAMQMGCHLYIEKPMSLTIQEGRYLVNCARKYKRVTQVGTQQRSLPVPLWACKQIHDGVLGKIKIVEAPNFVGPYIWEDQPGQHYPDGMTDEIWDQWTNQAVLRPYHLRLHRDWTHWWDYDAGGRSFGVSGWGTHSYDQVNMVLGTSETGPVEIVLEEPCEARDSGRYDNRELDETVTTVVDGIVPKLIGPRAKIKMWFANGVELRLHFDGDRGPGLGCIVTGEKGKMEINRSKVTSNPKEIAASLPAECRNDRPETIYHIENWIDGVKTGKKCAADIEYGQRATTLCELVNIVRATAPVGEKIDWDPVKERFTNNDKGNSMLSRSRRKGYELPELR